MPPPNATRSLGARSVEGGLLTVVLRGKDTYFGGAEAAGAALEIEDLASLHITGDAAYAQVDAVLAGGGGCHLANGLEGSSWIPQHWGLHGCGGCSPHAKPSTGGYRRWLLPPCKQFAGAYI